MNRAKQKMLARFQPARPIKRRDLEVESLSPMVAYANVKLAKAQAESLDVQGQAIARNPSVLQLRSIEVQMAQAGRWNGVLPVNVYGSAPIPFMNLGAK